MTINNGLTVLNDSEKEATFSSGRGESWIDVTIGKGIREWTWEVIEEDMLSDHRGIEIILGEKRGERPETRSRGKWVNVYEESCLKQG